MAAFDETDRRRLLADVSIDRNHRKINAATENAGRFQRLRDKYGSIKGWLDSHPGKSQEEWAKLLKSRFVFTGTEPTGEFLMTTGYLPLAHESRCWHHAED